MSEQGRLQGRAGIVTGAASGIGRAAALRLAREGAGLTLVDLNRELLEEAAREIRKAGGPEPLLAPADVSDEAQVGEFTAACRDKLGAVDFLVTSAGILRRTGFTDLQPKEWELVLKVNLTGPFLCCRAAAPIMIEQGRGSIVNVASLAGRTVSVLGGAHYTVSKHGVVGLSRHLARELGPFGVRVNAFCPGGTMTPMVTQVTPPEELEATAAKFPLRRWGRPEEQAAAIAYLVSDESSYMTGACLDSNGGAVML